MALKQVIVSDISGEELAEAEHARVVVTDYPNLAGAAVELDVSVAEAGKLQTSKIDIVTLDVYEPNKPKRSVVLNASALSELFEGVNMDDVVAGARRVEPTTFSQRRRTVRSSAARGEKIDYTAPDHFGQLHRGRVTSEEAELVRKNREQASANRQAQGHPPIDFDDAREKARYFDF